MRILMVVPQPFFRPRGTPFSVLHRVRALSRLGHEVDLVTYPFGESMEVPCLTIHRSRRPPGVRDVPVGPSLAKLALDLPLCRAAGRMLRAGSYDLLHTHEEAGYWGARAARRAAVPHLYDMHSSLPQQFANFDRFNWPPIVAAFRYVERKTLDGAHLVIAICQELHDHVRALGYRMPVAVIENTLDFEMPEIARSDITDLRTRLGIREGPTVVYTGTFESYQGLDLLIRAIPLVVRRVPHVRFVLVGGTERQAGALRELAGKVGVGDEVIVQVAVPPLDVFRYHRLADVLVTTRIRGTNTPLKIYQYLRSGRPIVATDIDSHTQVLTPHTAELVRPNPGEIANGVIGVLTDHQRAKRLAAAAGDLVRDRYGEERYLDALRGLLKLVTGLKQDTVAV